jgi:hypothetical protein
MLLGYDVWSRRPTDMALRCESERLRAALRAGIRRQDPTMRGEAAVGRQLNFARSAASRALRDQQPSVDS